MVRWRLCMVLAMLMVFVQNTTSDEEDEEEESEEENDNGDDDDRDGDEDDPPEKTERVITRRSMSPQAPTAKALIATRTTKKRPLECYVCAFKAETPIKACLDPTKYRVHTMTCPNADDKCFTSVIAKGQSYEAVVRGCRSACVGSPETTCCELSRCNSQALSMPLIPPRVAQVMSTNSKSEKMIPPTVFFFVSVLLVLQTVVKVAIV